SAKESGMAQPIDFDDDDPPCLWLLNPYELNRCSRGEKGPTDLYDPKNLGWDEREKAYYSYSELLLETCIGWDGPIVTVKMDHLLRKRNWGEIECNMLA